MAPNLVVVIRENPLTTHRAAEAVRIALGLSTGGNPLTVVLLNEAPVLLRADASDLVDADILDKHLPVLKELKVPFVVPAGAKAMLSLDSEFLIREAAPDEISAIINGGDRVLAF